MQRVNLHARTSIIQVGCPTCCYQVCVLDHAMRGTADLGHPSQPCHRNGYNFRNKICRELKMGAILKILKYYTQLQFVIKYEKIVPNHDKNMCFSWWWRHRWRHRVASNRPSIFLYKWNNYFFMITKNRAKISSLNLLCIGIMRLWLHFYKSIFMTSLMTSPGHKEGQILKLIYLRQYLS